MMPLLIGSQAMIQHGIDIERAPKDWDYISYKEDIHIIIEEHGQYTSKWEYPDKILLIYGIRQNPKKIIEIELADNRLSNQMLLSQYSMSPPLRAAIPSDLFLLKESHKYLKNSPHFEKTRKDIFKLRELCGFPGCEEILQQREKETYNYLHPNLNVSKDYFFSDDNINYVFDHDDIHRIVSLHNKEYCPAYMGFRIPGEEVLCSKELFDSCTERVKLRAVYEEATVLALERSQIPFKDKAPDPYWSFKFALQKVCTSITSGWFREYAWENYDKALEKYPEGYTEFFWNQVNLDNVLLHGEK